MYGTKIRKFRIENGYSQKEFADLLNVTVRTVSRWEQDRNNPNPDELEKLNKLIGLSSEDDNRIETGLINEAIAELKSQNVLLMEQISSYKKELEHSKSDIRHKRIRTAVITGTCLIILALIFVTWIHLINHGIKGKVIEGSEVIGTPSYFNYESEQ